MKIDGNFGHDWDSFIFWHGMNWRNFTFIDLTFELQASEQLTIYFSLLGINTELNIMTDKYCEEMDKRRKELMNIFEERHEDTK